MTTTTKNISADDLAAVRRCKTAYDQIRKELAEVIVGQDEVIEQVLIAVFARGHALLEGVPGLAKTLLVSSLAEATHLSFKRIQFTPDLMPSDVTGTEVIQEDQETRERQYKFLPGPLFANMILADEINRTPPKTQAAMLEAMQERQISARRQDPPPARPVLRAGHAEPAGAGRHLSAARSPVGPLPAVHQGELPEPGRGMGDCPPRDGGPLGPHPPLAFRRDSRLIFVIPCKGGSQRRRAGRRPSFRGV